MATSWPEIIDLGDRAAPAEAAEQPQTEEERSGVFRRLRESLSKSRQALREEISASLFDRIDEETWERLEEALILADAGAPTTADVVGRLEQEVESGAVAADGAAVQERLIEILAEVASTGERRLDLSADPAVLLMVGVNGTGKTTTCGKLARALVGDGRSVLLGAADTFRAAAADQLVTWGTRVGAEVVRGEEAADPASVAFEAVKAGVERKVDTVLIDTAGRLHTKQGLMDELGKVKRVVERQARVDEVLLVLDATTGQNGLIQARVFSEVVDVTGIVLTKLDGTAKGGIVIAVQRELGVPVKLIGLGEGPDDLAPFEPEAFVDALLGEPMEVPR